MKKLLLVAALGLLMVTSAFAKNRDLGYHATHKVVKAGSKVVKGVSKAAYKVGRFVL